MPENGTSLLASQSARERDEPLARGRYYLTKWDQFFNKYVTVANLFAYPVQRFDFHYCRSRAGLAKAAFPDNSTEKLDSVKLRTMPQADETAASTRLPRGTSGSGRSARFKSRRSERN